MFVGAQDLSFHFITSRPGRTATGTLVPVLSNRWLEKTESVLLASSNIPTFSS